MPADVTRYYPEHVEADAVHEQLAVRGICAALVEEDPASADSILFGAFTCLDLEARMASAMLTSWGVAVMTERTSLPEVVLCPDGPMLLRGDHVVIDDDGVEHRTTRPVSAVCRCGHSATKPWCDGTHKVALRQRRKPPSRGPS